MNVDFSPFAGLVLQMSTPLVMGLISVLLGVIIRKLHLSAENDIRAYLLVAAQNAVNYGISRVSTRLDSHLLTMQIKNQVLAEAVIYVLKQVPGAVKKLGLTEEMVQRLVEAKLGELMSKQQPPGK